MKYDDVEGMMRRRAEGCDDDKTAEVKPDVTAVPAPAKLDPALDPEVVCPRGENCEFDPIACQAKLNEAFLKQNGLAI